ASFWMRTLRSLASTSTMNAAHDIEHGLEREHRDPAARQGYDAALGRQQAGERDREQKHGAVQDRHEDRRPAPHQGLAPLAPQLGGGKEGVGRYDKRAQHDAGERQWAKSGTMQATAHAIAPAHIATQSTGRP